MALPFQIQIHPLQPQGAAMVVNRAVTLGVASSDGQGHGYVDVFMPGMEGRLRELFEQPRDVKDSTGKVIRVLNPWTRESLQYLLREGLRQQGLMGECAGEQP